jgi:prepilin-type N-terminal cleavage/methylation domain-containing protein
MAMRLRNYRPRAAPRGFTLVEMLAVVAIIAVVAGMLLTATMKAREKQRVNATRSLIQRIELALEHYRNTYGQWPPAIGTTPTSEANNALAQTLLELDAVAARGGATSAPSEIVDQNGSTYEPGDTAYVVDIWGNRINVIKNGHNTPGLDIWSNGPDGESNRHSADPKSNGDDVVNWTRQ